MRAQSVALLTGAAPVIVVISIYKVCVAALNDIIVAQGPGSTVPKLLDISRYRLVISQFVRGLVSFELWSPNLTIAMPLLLFFYFLLLGASIKKEGCGSDKYCCAVTRLHDGWLFLCVHCDPSRFRVSFAAFLESVASSGLATCDICVLCDCTSA